MDAIYARQSIDKKDSVSIESQIELCRKQAAGEVKVYEDRGYSGKNTNRPAFEQLINDICSGGIDKILVYRLDRFSRSIADFGRVWELLEKHGVQFESVTEKFDTSTPMGRAMLNIIMTFAQLERETIADRVKDNYYHRFALGAWPGGPAPMGFDIGRIEMPDGKKASTLVPNEQMDTVIYIFETYASSDVSLGELARMLNEKGIPGARRAAWDNVRVARILKNPVYVLSDEDVFWYYKSKGLEITQSLEAFKGLFACNLVGKRKASTGEYTDASKQKLSLANHVGCISSELFLKCQYKIENNRQLDRSMVGKYTWLTGLLKCKSCGYAVKVNKQGDNLFLVCSGRSNLKVCDESLHIDIQELEKSVAQSIEAMAALCPSQELAPDDHDVISAEVLAIEGKIERLVGALAECSDVSVQYINKEIERLHAERSQLIEKQSAVSKRKQTNELSTLNFEEISFEEKKIVASVFIEKILLSGNTAEIIWKV